MIQYYITHEEGSCCGCGACENICHYSAISMHKNIEGFLYPIINETKCINCGACKTVCPMENPILGVAPIAAYALVNKDEDILKNSSSGGAFRTLADYVINKGGYVIGCVLDDNMQASFRMTKNLTDVEAMQGSKYISSCPSNLYKEIKNKLKEGATILFTGSPCQNAALICYLKECPDNLITVDFLCHGMPAQNLFDEYIKYLEEKYHSKVHNFQFRDKRIRGWGLVESFCVGKKKHHNVGVTSTYLYGYTHGFFNRYSCYSCPFRGKRITDFTISDYWGVKKHHQLPDIEKGVSAITINSSKAYDIFEEVKDKVSFYQTEVEWIAEENPSINDIHKEHIPQIRKNIYAELYNNNWNTISHKYLTCPKRLIKKIWYSIPRRITHIIKK